MRLGEGDKIRELPFSLRPGGVLWGSIHWDAGAELAAGRVLADRHGERLEKIPKFSWERMWPFQTGYEDKAGEGKQER